MKGGGEPGITDTLLAVFWTEIFHLPSILSTQYFFVETTTWEAEEKQKMLDKKTKVSIIINTCIVRPYYNVLLTYT